ncbi:hypothetical protein J6590_105928, partial [Homalodisca vitripennis]
VAEYRVIPDHYLLSLPIFISIEVDTSLEEINFAITHDTKLKAALLLRLRSHKASGPKLALLQPTRHKRGGSIPQTLCREKI